MFTIFPLREDSPDFEQSSLIFEIIDNVKIFTK